MNQVIGPDQLEAMKWASKAFKSGDMHPATGLYAILTASGIVWVGLNPWRILGASTAGEEGLTAPSLGMHKFDHLKWTDPEDGERHPSEVEDLKGILDDGQSVVVEFNPDDFLGSLQHYIQLTGGSRNADDQISSARPGGAGHGDTIDLPKARAKEWKDEDGKPREYVVRDDADGDVRTLAPEHVVPFKGLHLRRVAPALWGYRETTKTMTKFGVVAERKRRPQLEVVEPQAKSVWGDGRG